VIGAGLLIAAIGLRAGMHGTGTRPSAPAVTVEGVDSRGAGAAVPVKSLDPQPSSGSAAPSLPDAHTASAQGEGASATATTTAVDGGAAIVPAAPSSTPKRVAPVVRPDVDGKSGPQAPHKATRAASTGPAGSASASAPAKTYDILDQRN
jgi:hypothetical protein